MSTQLETNLKLIDRAEQLNIVFGSSSVQISKAEARMLAHREKDNLELESPSYAPLCFTVTYLVPK